MKLINKAERPYIAFATVVKPNEIIEVADKKVIEILVKQPGVEEYVDKKDVEKLKEENKKLKEENKKQNNKKAD